MLDQIPLNCFANVARFLSQDDKVCLTRVSRSMYDRTVPYLYRRLYLNRRPHFRSDLDTSLGVQTWSVLRIPLLGSREEEIVEAEHAFRLLVRSLRSNVRLCHYIKSVYCALHINRDILFELISLLTDNGTVLQFFDNYLELDVMQELSWIAPRLKSLNVPPPSKLPEQRATGEYWLEIARLQSYYDWDMIRSLTLHIPASTLLGWFSKPLRISSLTLNLRPDTYLYAQQPLYALFDVDTLKELRIVSWYKGADTNVCKMWRLYDFYRFRNVTSLTLLSLDANNEYLRECAQHFTKLEKLQVDFLLDVPLDGTTLSAFRKAECSQTLRYIDVKFEPLDPPLLSINRNYFLPRLTCRCSDCRETFEQIIIKKYFPTQEKLRINSMLDVNARNFIMHMFTLFPILPHTDFIDSKPAIAYLYCTPEEHAAKVNELLRHDPSSDKAITAQDIICLYYAHIHSLKRTFDYFNSGFPQLEFLVLNDLPTRITRGERQQTVNMPLFYSQNYTSNQEYLIVNDESLFD
ncbi:hypothetical protein HG536_0C01560 [Torulaspora globosa]|uniref:F-box domain-containing protein n=1 Tax=Torulaspora globosa TaxID=48254 RepID=A0A7G3ZEQ2_9SACH|nr:uncharacterized protein HG536_0C01560 [Torulaspora globosa]QLL31988.1 hypothetical protein HG536_0C01560 [Torulaspora globosa]